MWLFETAHLSLSILAFVLANAVCECDLWCTFFLWHSYLLGITISFNISMTHIKLKDGDCPPKWVSEHVFLHCSKQAF